LVPESGCSHPDFSKSRSRSASGGFFIVYGFLQQLTFTFELVQSHRFGPNRVIRSQVQPQQAGAW
jgi:hypothetical protein